MLQKRFAGAWGTENSKFLSAGWRRRICRPVVATQTFLLGSGGPGEHTPSRNEPHWSDERIGGGLKKYRFRRRTARTDDAVPRLGVPPLLGPAPAAELSGALASPFPRKGEAGFRDNRKNKLIAFGADRFR